MARASSSGRDDFSKATRDALALRAAYHCSRPECRRPTVSVLQNATSDPTHTGKAAHITAAAKGGPRFDPTLAPPDRKSQLNGIYLCSTCADLVDKGNGGGFASSQLRGWKDEHDVWVRERHNERDGCGLTIVDGVHHGEGVFDVSGATITGPAILKPGTKTSARGFSNVAGLRVGPPSPPAAHQAASTWPQTLGVLPSLQASASFGAEAAVGVYCAKCNSLFGLVTSGRCPTCGGPFSTPPR